MPTHSSSNSGMRAVLLQSCKHMTMRRSAACHSTLGHRPGGRTHGLQWRKAGERPRFVLLGDGPPRIRVSDKPSTCLLKPQMHDVRQGRYPPRWSGRSWLTGRNCPRMGHKSYTAALEYPASGLCLQRSSHSIADGQPQPMANSPTTTTFVPATHVSPMNAKRWRVNKYEPTKTSECPKNRIGLPQNLNRLRQHVGLLPVSLTVNDSDEIASQTFQGSIPSIEAMAAPPQLCAEARCRVQSIGSAGRSLTRQNCKHGRGVLQAPHLG